MGVGSDEREEGAAGAPTGIRARSPRAEDERFLDSRARHESATARAAYVRVRTRERIRPPAPLPTEFTTPADRITVLNMSNSFDSSILDRMRELLGFGVASAAPEAEASKPSTNIDRVTELLMLALERAPKLLDDDRADRFREQAVMVLNRFACVSRARSARRAANRFQAAQRAVRSLLTTLRWDASDEWQEFINPLVAELEAFDGQITTLLERERALDAEFLQMRRAS